MLEVTLAYTPTQDELKRLRNWFNANFDKKVSLEFKMDKSLVAGVVVAYQGRIYDYSLAKKVDKVYESLQKLS